MTEDQLRDLAGRLTVWVVVTALCTVVGWAVLLACGVVVDPVLVLIPVGFASYALLSVTR